MAIADSYYYFISEENGTLMAARNEHVSMTSNALPTVVCCRMFVSDLCYEFGVGDLVHAISYSEKIKRSRHKLVLLIPQSP